MQRKNIIIYAIIFTLLSSISFAQEKPTLYPKKSGDKYGFYDKSGNLSISAIYDNALGFSNGLAAVKKDGKWGYINESGTKVIDYLYEDAWYFTEGLAAVKKDGKWGYIDKTGTTKIDFIFDDAADFSEGLAWVRKDKKIGFIDKNGKVSIDYQFGAATSFDDGLAGVQKNAKWGFIDKDGKVVIDYKYDDAKCFENELAPVKLINKWGFIDKTGKVIIDYTYDNVKQDYRDASFGWTYAESSYNLAKAAAVGSTERTNYINHLNRAIKIIQDKNTYLYKDDWEKLLKYYELTGDTEKAAIAKKKIKEYKNSSSSSSSFHLGSSSESGSIDLSFGVAPLKYVFSKGKLLPIEGQLRIGQLITTVRYVKFEDYVDKWRFGAWQGGTAQEDVSNTYTGSNFSVALKFAQSNDIDRKKLGYGHDGPVVGADFRYGKYNFVEAYTNVTEPISGQNLGMKRLHPVVSCYDLSFIMGYNYSCVPFFVDVNYSIGLGIKNIEMEYSPSKYTIEDERFKTEKWSGIANFYMPFRVGARIGLTIF